METRFLIVDGNSITCRGAFAKPDLVTSKGVYTGGTHLFFVMLNSIMYKIKPTHVLVAFDVSRKTFRNDIAPDYKANREGTNNKFSLKMQLQQVQHMLTLAGVKVVSVEGFEADDVIGTYASLSGATENYILSGDRDTFQLINANTKVIYPLVGVTNVDIVDEARFKAKFDIDVNQFIDYKSLAGDKGDNVEGCPSCGKKTAAKLLQTYGSLDNVSDHAHEVTGKFGEKLRDWLPKKEIARYLVTIRKDVEVPYSFEDCKLEPDWMAMRDMMVELEMNSLLGKLEGGKFYAQKKN